MPRTHRRVPRRSLIEPAAGSACFLPGKLAALVAVVLASCPECCAEGTDNAHVFPGADERTPSYSQYFSWINNTNEGSTEQQTLTNPDFFKWLQDNYGMVPDIYVISAGAIDKFKPEIWLTTYPAPFSERLLTLAN